MDKKEKFIFASLFELFLEDDNSKATMTMSTITKGVSLIIKYDLSTDRFTVRSNTKGMQVSEIEDKINAVYQSKTTGVKDSPIP